MQWKGGEVTKLRLCRRRTGDFKLACTGRVRSMFALPLPNLKTDSLLSLQVEFEDALAHTGLLSRRSEDQHAAFHNHLAKRGDSGVAYETLHSYAEPKIFTGVSIKLANEADLNAVRRAPGVKRVTRTRKYDQPHLSYAPASADAVKAACQSKDGLAPHVMTQVSRLHKKGYYGKGVTVGVIDSGIDYRHPALNGGLPSGTPCFGPGCPVIGGYDFIDNKPDPYAGCPGGDHGTHVSAILSIKTVVTNQLDFIELTQFASLHRNR